MTALLFYDATSGSNTAPSDASGSGSSASGTGAATTISLGATVDLSGDPAVANDGTDYIWCSTTAGERHLFRITSFTGGTAACTAVVVAEAIGATTFSGANWHINGSRLSLESDSSNEDWLDWMPGWVIELEAGTYDFNALFSPGVTGTYNSNTSGMTIRASSTAVSRPVLNAAANVNCLNTNNNQVLLFKGVKWTTNGGSSSCGMSLGGGSVTMIDVVIDMTAATVKPNSLIVMQYGSRRLSLDSCYLTGGVQEAITVASGNHFHFKNGVIDGQGGTYFATAGLEFEAYGNQVWYEVTDSLVVNCGGDGIKIATGLEVQASIRGNTCVDNGGDGISLQDEANTSDGTPNHFVQIVNNLCAFNSAYGFVTPSTTSGRWQMKQSSIFAGNATYANTSGAYSGQIAVGDVIDAVTCTADPFTDRSADDYTLNNTAGGGALLREAAYPATLPDGT